MNSFEFFKTFLGGIRGVSMTANSLKIKNKD